MRFLEKLEWLGVYEDVEIGLTKATPAEVLLATFGA